MIDSYYGNSLSKYLLTILGILGFLPVFCQEYTISKLRLFPDRDEVLIKDVACDSLGFIWFLTNGEIYRYDGYRSLDILKTISDQRLADDIPHHILIGPRNRLWMAGNNGLSYLDLKSWSVHSLSFDSNPETFDQTVHWMKLLSNATVAVAFASGHILLIEGDQMTWIEELYKSDQNKINLHDITWWDEKYWIGTSAGILYSIDPKDNYAVVGHSLPGVDKGLRSVIAHEGGLLLNIFEKGVYRFREGRGIEKVQIKGFEISPHTFNLLEEGPGYHVYADATSACILDENLQVRQRLEIPSTYQFRTASIRFNNKEVLLGNEEGLFVIYPKTKGLSQLIPSNAGPNKSTRGIYVYPDGAIFYGTYDGAGYISPKGTPQVFSKIKHAYALLPMENGNLLIGTEGGFLKIFDREQGRIHELPYTLSPRAQQIHAFHRADYVLSLAETHTHYLIGSMAGLWSLSKKEKQLDRLEAAYQGIQLADLQIRHIRVDEDSSLVLSTHLGLYRLKDSNLNGLYPHSGKMGVYKSITLDDEIWLATQGQGLVKIDGRGDVIKNITTKEGLSNNLVYSLEHVRGTLIAGTADGLNLVKGNRIRNIDRTEGLLQSEFNSGASFWDRERQRVFVGGLMGYTILDMTLDWMYENERQLESYITEFQLSKGSNGTKIVNYTWPYREKDEEELILTPGQSLTALYLGTPGNYRANGKIRYRVNGGGWENLAKGQFISIIEPSPGQYRIDLETLNAGMNRKLKSFTIVKLPYYYETWWFKLLVLLFLLALVVVWYRASIEKVRREQALRNRIAADLHDEVGSSLTRIFYQVSNLSNGNTNPKRAEEKLKLIAETSKEALNTMSDMVWSIDSRYDTMQDLGIRMKDYAYRLREEFNFSYKFQTQGDTKSVKVSQVVRQNLLLIFKEALNNAIKYGDGSRIDLIFRVGEGLHLTISNRFRENNPVQGVRQGGKGVENMKVRASKMGGELTILKENGRFTLQFDLLPKRGI